MELNWFAILIPVALVLGLLAILIVFDKKKSGAGASPAPAAPAGTPPPPKPSIFAGLKGVGTWWVMPVVLWLTFWFLFWYSYPSAWLLMWKNWGLLLVANVIFVGLIAGGRNKVDQRGRPEKPLFPKILGLAVVLLFSFAVWEKASPTNAAIAAEKIIPAIKATGRNFYTPAVQQPMPLASQATMPVQTKKPNAPRAEEISADESDVIAIVVYPKGPKKREITIPQGYTVAPGKWSEKANIASQTPDGNGDMSTIFISKSSRSEEILLRIVPVNTETCHL